MSTISHLTMTFETKRIGNETIFPRNNIDKFLYNITFFAFKKAGNLKLKGVQEVLKRF